LINYYLYYNMQRLLHNYIHDYLGNIMKRASLYKLNKEKIAADQEFVEGRYALGYVNDIDNNPDRQNVVKNLQQDALHGVGKKRLWAKNALGYCLAKGIGVQKAKPETAVSFFREAYEGGYREAQYNLAYCLLNGIGVKAADPVEALNFFWLIAYEGHAESQAEIVKLAEQGNVQAQYFSGILFTKVNHIAPDPAKAAIFFGMAAKQGHAIALAELQAMVKQGNPEAEYAYGYCLAHGIGVQKDEVEAVTLLWKATNQGHAQAPAELRNLAEQGNAAAQYAYGACLVYGTGVQQDEAEGLKLLRLSADQGNAGAQCNLAHRYLYGTNGLQKDKAEGIRLYRAAAMKGLPVAQYNLGVCYEDGVGVAKDTVQAARWYGYAAENGYAKAQAALADIQGFKGAVRRPSASHVDSLNGAVNQQVHGR
jgi:TPR repeat protein